MKPWIVAPLGLALAACATGAPPEVGDFGSRRVDMSELEPAEAPPPRKKKREKISLDQHAKTYMNAERCMQAAKGMYAFEAKKAWGLLMACAKRQDFTRIDAVLGHPWIDEIKRRPKAGAVLVSRIVAHRGGDLALDLGIVNDRGVQLFGLPTAFDAARVFRGRYVLLRGRVLGLDEGSGAVRVRIAELDLQAKNIKTRYSSSRARSLRREGRAARSLRSGADLVVDTVNVAEPTHRRLHAFTKRPVPGLGEGVERLFLVRFDELLPTPPKEAPDTVVARAALVAAFRPPEAKE